MRPLAILFLLVLPAVVPAASEAHCNADLQPSTVLTRLNVKGTRLSALIRLGYEEHLCFGLQDPDPAILTETVHLTGSGLTVEDVLRRLLPNGHPYAFSQSNGVFLIRRTDSNPVTWLDNDLTFLMDRTTVQWASMSLFVALARTANPSIGGLVGSYDPGNVTDMVGPIHQPNRPVRDLLSLIVGGSRGGAWISRECAVVDESITREPCWTVLEYSLPLPSTLAQAEGFWKKAR